MSKHNTHFHDKIRKIMKQSKIFFLSYREKKRRSRSQKRVLTSHGKRAIGVQAIAVRL